MMTTPIRPLVDCAWLRAALSSSTKENLRVLECMWLPKKMGIANFLEEHIPTARYFDMLEGVKIIPTLSCPLPSPESFTKQLEREGVSDATHLILYDKVPNMFFAARLWFQCKEIGLKNVSVLDGGFRCWKNLGYALEAGPSSNIQPGSVTLNHTPKFCGLQEMTEILQQGNIQIVDTREPEHFQGQTAEPSHFTRSALKLGKCDVPKVMHAGHMTSSRNICYDTLVDKNTECFKDKEALRKVFNDAGLDENRKIIGTCYNGLSACMLPLAASKFGGDAKNFTVYLGSWTEFGQRGSKEYIRTGPPLPMNNSKL